MGVKFIEHARGLFTPVRFATLPRGMPHFFDMSGLFHTWVMACESPLAAYRLATNFPAVLRRRFPAAGSYTILCDAATPVNKQAERAARREKTVYDARRLGVDLTAEASRNTLPLSMCTPEVLDSLAAGPMTLLDVLGQHGADTAVMAVEHGAPWDKVLLPFSARRLVRIAIDAARADLDMEVIDDPAITPEGEIGIVTQFMRSGVPRGVVVSKDSDVYVAWLLQGAPDRQMFYWDTTLAARHPVHVVDMSSALYGMSMERRRQTAFTLLFTGCDYVKWKTPTPTPIRLAMIMSGSKKDPAEAFGYLCGRPDWIDDAGIAEKLEERYAGAAQQMLRAKWAMAYYGGDRPSDITQFGWNADGTLK